MYPYLQASSQHIAPGDMRTTPHTQQYWSNKAVLIVKKFDFFGKQYASGQRKVLLLVKQNTHASDLSHAMLPIHRKISHLGVMRHITIGTKKKITSMGI
jgi:hypothetical protein